MKHLSASLGFAFALVFSLAACSSGSEESNAANPTADTTAKNAEPPFSASRPSAQEASPSQDKVAGKDDASAPVIGLTGLGTLRIGQPVPSNGSWAERGAQTNDACRTVSSLDFPGVYAIVVDGKVQRITVGQRSDVMLAEGIGTGSTLQDVEKRFAGFRVTPHKYESAPAKYLTSPNAMSGNAALRFEIGRNGKVSLIHVGTMPALGYVEGCA